MDRDLAVSLEEFGLSIYEARAYVGLVSKNDMTASQLAYYTDIPRTKTYSVVGKLEKKGLVVLSKGKPITYSAVAPQDAFDKIIQEQINRINSMNGLVSNLKQIYENNRKSNTIKDTRYIQLDMKDVVECFIKMIDGTTSTIEIMVDSLGLGMIKNCKKHFILALKRGVDVKILIRPEQIGTQECIDIPVGIKLRVSDVTQNCLVFDHTQLLTINNQDGKGAVFSSANILGAVMTALFDSLWSKSFSIEALADMTKNRAKEIYQIISLIKEFGLQHVLNSEDKTSILSLLEKHNIDVKTKSFEEMVEMIDIILAITCKGNATYDEKAKNLTIDSMYNGGSSLPWAHLMMEFLHSKKYTTRFVHKMNNSDGEKIHIKIT